MNKMVAESKKFTLPSPVFEKVQESVKRRTPAPVFQAKVATAPSRYSQQRKSQKHMWRKEPSVSKAELSYCESCEVELHSVDALRTHRAQHERCPVNGCNYQGHPTVMDKHVSVLHSSGLFDKMKKLSTPAEIAAWREERRKRYPTVENVVMRQRAQEQRQRRGERLEENKSRFGKREDRRPMQRTNRNTQNRPTDNQNHRRAGALRGRNHCKRPIQRYKVDSSVKEGSNNKQIEALERETVEDEISAAGIVIFRGTSKLQDYKHAKAKTVEKNVLFGLVGMYGSEDEDSNADETDDEEDSAFELLTETKERDSPEKQCDVPPQPLETNKGFINSSNCMVTVSVDEENEKNSAEISVPSNEFGEISSTECKNNLERPSEKVPLSNELNDGLVMEACNNDSADEAPEEKPISRTGDIPESAAAIVNNDVGEPPEKRMRIGAPTKLNNVRQEKSSRILDHQKRLRKQNTMLEKLLQSDIRHERNVLLQCVRYICENDYFGIGATSKS